MTTDWDNTCMVGEDVTCNFSALHVTRPEKTNYFQMHKISIPSAIVCEIVI